MLESVTFWTLDGTDYIEIENGNIVIHRLDTANAAIEVPEECFNGEEGHWLLEK